MDMQKRNDNIRAIEGAAYGMKVRVTDAIRRVPARAPRRPKRSNT